VIGFVLGVLCSLALYLLRHRIQATVDSSRSRFSHMRERVSTGLEERYREQVIERAEHYHLLKDYAPLSELYQSPYLNVPQALPPRRVPSQGGEQGGRWKDVRLYDALHPLPTTVQLDEALRQHNCLAIAGPMGSGRTSLLAYLAQRYARGEGWRFTLPESQEDDSPELIADRDRERDRLPVWIALESIDLSAVDRGGKHTLIEPIADYVSTTVDGVIAHPSASMVRNRIASGRCLLLIDNLDLLAPSVQLQALEWIGELTRAYPNNAFVVVGAAEGYEAMWQAGFAVLLVEGFRGRQVVRFAERWEAMRANDAFRGRETRDVSDQMAAEGTLSPTAGDPDLASSERGAQLLETLEPPPHLLDMWLAGRGESVLPLDLAWAALLWREEGSVPASPRAHYAQIVVRALGRARDGLLKPPQWVRVLSMAAWDMQLEGRYTAPRSVFEEQIIRFLDQAYEAAAHLRDDQDQDEKPDFGRQARAAFGVLIESGDLLHEAEPGAVKFVHPMLRAYFAGQHAARTDQSKVLIEHVHDPQWQDTIVFYAALADVTALAMARLRKDDDVFRSNFFAAAGYLAASPKVDNRLRGGVLAELAQIVMDPEQPMALGQRAARYIATSGDKGALYLFGQALRHAEPRIRQLGVSGLGYVNSDRVAVGLEHALSDPDHLVRIEALHAYSLLDGTLAYDGLLRGLQDEDELTRQAAAEILARLGGEGHQLLREGVQSEDMYIRRAAISGLGTIDEPWAYRLVDEMRRLDDEWFVRSAATEVLERLQADPPAIAPDSPQRMDFEWLSAWAERRGVAVSSSDEIRRAMVAALDDEEWTIRVAAADTLAAVGGQEAIGPLCSALEDADNLVREAAYGALYEVARRTRMRVEAPSPK
jgi:HEAT repeat protein